MFPVGVSSPVVVAIAAAAVAAAAVAAAAVDPLILSMATYFSCSVGPYLSVKNLNDSRRESTENRSLQLSGGLHYTILSHL